MRKPRSDATFPGHIGAKEAVSQCTADEWPEGLWSATRTPTIPSRSEDLLWVVVTQSCAFGIVPRSVRLYHRTQRIIRAEEEPEVAKVISIITFLTLNLRRFSLISLLKPQLLDRGEMRAH